jgi:hypothetical protein
MSHIYTRVFLQILDSSIAEDFMLRHVFEDFLKLADYKTGTVDMTRFALSRRLNIPLEVLNEKIGVLESPDPASRDPEFEGRRIRRLDEHRDWGWQIINWEKYEQINRRAGSAERMAKTRESDSEIDAIWAAYPRKVGKPAAIPKIRAAINEVGFDSLLLIVNQYAETRIGEPEKFTPHPATWFNQKRYNDDPSTWANGNFGAPTKTRRMIAV